MHVIREESVDQTALLEFGKLGKSQISLQKILLYNTIFRALSYLRCAFDPN